MTLERRRVSTGELRFNPFQDKDVTETINKYFINIKTLRLKPYKKYETDGIDLLTSQFDDHASIKNNKSMLSRYHFWYIPGMIPEMIPNLL